MLKTRRSFFMLVAAIIFLTAGTVHGFVAFGGWTMVINDWMIPQWVSMVASATAYLMAIASLSHLK